MSVERVGDVFKGGEDTSHYVSEMVPAYCYRFHFVTGKFPFEGENVFKLFAVISAGVFEMPPHLAPLLKDLIKGEAVRYPVLLI